MSSLLPQVATPISDIGTRGSSNPRPMARPPINLPNPNIGIGARNSDASFPPSGRVTTKIEFVLDWTIKIFGISAAVVFGVWAPLSYKATTDGNKSGLAAATAQAQSAYDMQSSAMVAQSMVLDVLQSRFKAIGQLQLFEFCNSATVWLLEILGGWGGVRCVCNMLMRSSVAIK
jgi:hypothetical protein